MMESTQELECTQDLYASQLERSCPEQIGFLGICGEKYPVKRGPNKIGRDSQTCSIVLNLNSISRQHAVINILKGTEYHLMDLDSANKTKLNNKRLQPFIPYPLRNGDTLQFGDVFGVFRVLEEDNDLPMTQAIEIPETPVITKHASRVAMTTVPESPDVSDRDDSFIIPSQPTKGNNFKSPSNKFIKPCAKTITIQPVGSKKIDNVYWNSLKQSPNIKFNLDDSDSSLNNDADIYEMETQQPSVNKSSDSIYTADTQVPTATGAIYTADTQEPGDKYSIYTAETQIPTKESIFDADTQVPTKESIYETETQIMTEKESIYEVNTHIPTINGDIDANTSSIYLMDTQLPSEHLPTVKKINNQQNMHFDLCGEKQHIENNEFSTNKDEPTIGIEDDDLLNATTQVPIERPISPVISIGKGNNSNTPVKNRVEVNDNGVCEPGKSEVADKKSVDKNDRSIDKINTSEENILFEEVDGQSFEEDLDSQPLLPRDMSPNDDNLEIPLSQTFVEDDVNIILPAKRENRVNSDQSTDCEDLDIVPTQKIPQKLNDDDLTDCEDDFIESNTVKVSPENVDIDDMATQVIEEIEKPGPESTTATEDAFDDLATQVIPDIEIDKQVDFENMPSQVLNEAPLKCKIFNILKEDNCSEEMVPSPFKIPMQPSSPRKAKKKITLNPIRPK